MPEFYGETFNLYVSLAPVLRMDRVTNPLLHYAANYEG
jgi:hypothetical protein